MSDVLAEAREALTRYLAHFREERERHAALQRQLASDSQLFDRSHRAGHLTASAAVLNAAGDRILLIDHVFLKKWLPPGGHYEAPGSLWDSARREVQEETGLADVQLHPWSLKHTIPIDIDSHPIAANPAKSEGAHVHHDFRFLATVSPGQADPALQPQRAEVHAARWAPIEELRTSSDERMCRLFRKLITSSRERAV